MDLVIKNVNKANLKYDTQTLNCYTIAKALLKRAAADSSQIQVNNAGWTNIPEGASF